MEANDVAMGHLSWRLGQTWMGRPLVRLMEEDLFFKSWKTEGLICPFSKPQDLIFEVV